MPSPRRAASASWKKWSDDQKLCYATADDYDRAMIDCAGSVAATAAELETLPARLRCDAVVGHWTALIASELRGKNANATTEVKDMVEQFIAGRQRINMRSCEQTPWTVERRGCVADAKTAEAAHVCK